MLLVPLDWSRQLCQTTCSMTYSKVHSPEGATEKIKRLNWVGGFHHDILAMGALCLNELNCRENQPGAEQPDASALQVEA